MSVSEWDNEYARLARAASQMRTAGLVTQASDARALQVGLQRLADALQTLPLQPTEVQRRQRLVQHLQQNNSTTGGGLDIPNNNSAPAVPQSSHMMLALRQQDDMIDELAVGAGRLKNQTIAIGDEAKMHVNLLNDMETNLDQAQVGLEGETRRAARLREDQSLWRLQLIAAGLFILLILLILLGLSP